MNEEKRQDTLIEALIVSSLLDQNDENVSRDQIDAFDEAASLLNEEDEKLLQDMDPLAKIKDGCAKKKPSLIEFPANQEENWIQAAARQKAEDSFDLDTRRAIETRRNEILEKRNKSKGAEDQS